MTQAQDTVTVTQADRDAAMAMLKHAFRYAPDDCTDGVDFDDISRAFARHREEALAEVVSLLRLVCKRADRVQEVSGGTAAHADLFYATESAQATLAKFGAQS